VDRSRLLLCTETREAVKARLLFASERWGSSGVLFAWDIWNEIHPSYAENTADPFEEFIEEVGTALREFEKRNYGRAHPQTVSIFGPHIGMDPRIAGSIFRHPALDFASTHFYWEGTIDDPQNTVDAAIDTGRLMRVALSEIRDDRPFLDSESGPIHTFKDHHITLPAPFDDEYFRHMQWAHFAAGGAGGGMRWPNRHPHILTSGMHRAQHGLARFLPLIDWSTFRRRNLNEGVRVSGPDTGVFASGDDAQAIVWLLRKDTIAKDGRLNRRAKPAPIEVAIPGLAPGRYSITTWDTLNGVVCRDFEVEHAGGATLCIEAGPLRTDLAIAVRRK
jgi:mannan endo-1,4-beta-mannosidase